MTDNEDTPQFGMDPIDTSHFPETSIESQPEVIVSSAMKFLIEQLGISGNEEEITKTKIVEQLLIEHWDIFSWLAKDAAAKNDRPARIEDVFNQARTEFQALGPIIVLTPPEELRQPVRAENPAQLEFNPQTHQWFIKLNQDVYQNLLTLETEEREKYLTNFFQSSGVDTLAREFGHELMAWAIFTRKMSELRLESPPVNYKVALNEVLITQSTLFPKLFQTHLFDIIFELLIRRAKNQEWR